MRPPLLRIALGGLAGAIVALAGTAGAAELDAELEAPPIEIHGFVSQGAIKSTDNNYLVKSARGSLQFTEVGLNLTAQPADKLRIGVQLFARDLGTVGNFNAKMDWFYLDYRWRDWLGVRAGRVKLPFGLYNDTSDIDAARPEILLPQSVYPLANRDFLLAQTGVELYGYIDLRRLGGLEYRLYAGSIYVAPTTTPGVTIRELDVPYVVGGRVMWETPVQGLRVGGSLQALRLDATLVLGDQPVNLEVPVLLGVGSVELVRHDLVLAAEFSQWRVRLKSNNPALYPGPGAKEITVSERGYLSASYHLKPWLWPALYYSFLFPDEADRTFSGDARSMQHDLSASFRFDINPHWLFKLEGHFMHGTAGLDPALNADVPLGNLTRDWAVFLAKTTAYF